MTLIQEVSTGIGELDQLLGNLRVGDNVVWHDDAGSLAMVFCLNFMKMSQALGLPCIYVSFDRSPKNLLDTLGSLADNPKLYILDCFTWGKGKGSEVFTRFYEREHGLESTITPVEAPVDVKNVSKAIYGEHGRFDGEVHFVFESLTGMQELWGGEEVIGNFYSHACPRLYELNTIAYWILEKGAHGSKLKASINQIAQVVIDLSIKRGTTSLSIMKAEKRDIDKKLEPHAYWTKGLEVTLESHRGPGGPLDLGRRVKELRGQRGLSQTELAKLVGVTPSTISQVESQHIYPSLPALMKMAEVLGVEVRYFFSSQSEEAPQNIFTPAEATLLKLPNQPVGALEVMRLLPLDLPARAEPYLIEIPPGKSLESHFFAHKGEEIGYLIAGKLACRLESGEHQMKAGDTIHLTTQNPLGWQNSGPQPASLLWVKIK